MPPLSLHTAFNWAKKVARILYAAFSIAHGVLRCLVGGYMSMLDGLVIMAYYGLDVLSSIYELKNPSPSCSDLKKEIESMRLNMREDDNQPGEDDDQPGEATLLKPGQGSSLSLEQKYGTFPTEGDAKAAAIRASPSKMKDPQPKFETKIDMPE